MSQNIRSFQIGTIFYQSGNGMPIHIATRGCVYINVDTGTMYINKDGLVNWSEFSSGSDGNPFDYLQLNTAATESVDVGKIVWNSTDGTFDMGLLNGVTLQSGQEMHMYAKASGAISNGDTVQFAGSQGNHLLIKKAVPTEINSNPEYFVGIATQDFANNDFGYVTVFGQVRDLDTSMYSGGTVLYYQSSGSTSGLLTDTRPTGPNAKITVAAVVRSHQNQGAIFVRPHVMPRIGGLQDVEVITPTSGDVLTYNSSSQVWENKTLNEITGHYSIKVTTPSSGVTGTVAETQVLKVEIPANSLSLNEIISMPLLIMTKTGTAGTCEIRVKISTSSTMPSGNTDAIARYSSGVNNLFAKMQRDFIIDNGTIKVYPLSSNVIDNTTSTVVISTKSFDPTVTNYLYVSLQQSAIGDSSVLQGFYLTNQQ